MNKFKLLAMTALAGSLLLSGCSILGTRAAAVSGQLKGFAKDQNLRLAIVGYNNGTYTADASRAQLIDKFLTSGYTLTLPTKVPYGTYRVVVFRDRNNNEKFDLGEPVLSRNNGKLLVYAERDNTPFNGAKYGWNIYNVNAKNVESNFLTNYDLKSVE